MKMMMPPAARGSFKKPPLDPTKFLIGLFFTCLFYGSLSFGQSAVKIEYPLWRSYTNSNYVKDLVLDKHILWAAAGGVIKYDLEKGTYIKYVKEHGLAGNNVLKLALYNNSLWIVTATGITCHNIEKNTWKSFYKTGGLPDDAVMAVTVDTTHHAVWFGTWEGYLYSFDMDKEKWHFLPAETRIPDTMITSLAIDAATGCLLVGTWGKGLYSYQPGTQLLLNRSFPDKQSPDNQDLDFISTLFIENQKGYKKLWLGTVNNGLWIMDLNTNLPGGSTTGFPKLQKVRDLPDDWITDIAASPGQDHIFITTRSSGLFIYSAQIGPKKTFLKANPGLFTTSTNTTTNTTTTATTLNACVAGKDYIFLGSEGDGIIQLNRKNGNITPFKFTNEIANNKVSVITPDNRNHRIWIGTEGNGAARYDSLTKTWTTFNAANNILSSDVVNCITVDNTGDAAWIGTDHGMVHCNNRNGKFRRYGLTEGLSSVMVYASAYDAVNTLWAAFYYGCPAIFNREKEKWQPMENIPGTVCYELGMEAKGASPSMWLATTSGIMHYDPQNHKTTRYWPDTEFRSLLVDTTKREIWAGSWGKGLFHMEIDTGRQSQVKAFENLSILDIKKDLQKGTIWFATNEGVFSQEADGYSFTHFDARDGLGMNYVLAIGITGDSIWFGTWGGGVSRLLK